MSTRPLPVDRVAGAYNLVLACAWALLWHAAPYAPMLCLGHAAGTGLPALLRRWEARDRTMAGGGWGAFVRTLTELYPLLWIVAFWLELDLFHHLPGAAFHDRAVRGLDLAVFGRHLHVLLMQLFPQMWFSETIYFVYLLYFPVVFLPPVLMGLIGRSDARRDMIFRLLLTYAACNLVYLTYPVLGPMDMLPAPSGALTHGFFYHLSLSARASGDAIGTAFPSSHVSGSVTMALLAWRWFRPRVAALFTLQAVGVVFGTVYTHNHYGIDALAGVVWALSLQLLVAPPLLGLFGPRAAPHSIPILPAWAGGSPPVTAVPTAPGALEAAA